MSTKVFCDWCDVEITDDNRCGPTANMKAVAPSSALSNLYAKVERHKKPSMLIEVMTGSGVTWNEGDFCKYCVIAAVRSLDDRPVGG